MSAASQPLASSIAFDSLQDHGKTSATASLGMITLWDVEGGLPQIDKYLYSRDNHVVAGECIVKSYYCFEIGLITAWADILTIMPASLVIKQTAD